MTLNGPALVALDMSNNDEPLRQADALARALEAPLAVCHVLPDLSQVRVLFPQDAGPLPSSEVLNDRARTALTERVLRVTGRGPRGAEIRIESGSPHAGIRRAAEQLGAGVVVLGPGRTAAKLAHYPAWAVLVARTSPATGSVIGATDFSDPALPALASAAREAKRRNAPLRFLHAVHFDASVAMAWPAAAAWPTIDTAEALAEQARAQLTDSLARFEGAGEVLVLSGPAAAAIIDTARGEGASLVVVGTRGRSGLPRLLLGSVAESVMREAPCSVLAVPLHTDLPPHKVSVA
ncbi:MAG: universal stress protein [Vicinamibacterales bacterium]